MPRATAYILDDESKASVCFAAAAYLAILAYPEDRARQKKFIDAAKALHVRRYLDRGGVRYICRGNFIRKPDRIFKSSPLTHGEGSIYKFRLPAVMLAKQRLFGCFRENRQPGTLDSALCSLAKRRPPKLVQVKHADYQHSSALKNIGHRVWANTKPVLHLAMALEQHLAENSSYHLDVFWLLQRPQWVISAIPEAERSRQLLITIGILDDAETVLVGTKSEG